MGMNDGDYPRPRTPADFDLMEKDYRPGDRSRRDDDRYLFLEALLSARERLYISWVGRSIVDNSESPPSVLVGQLRDHISAVWRAQDGSDAILEQITIQHPLQGFSPQYFQDASPGARLFTYAREWRAQSDAATHRRRDEHTLLEAPRRDEPLSINDLRRFLEHPVREFFRQRLQVSHEEGNELENQETFVPEGLDNWSLRDALIQAARKQMDVGADPWDVCSRELARLHGGGQLAYGGAGHLQVEEGRESLLPVFDAYRAVLSEWPVIMDESLDISHGCEGTPGLAGWLHGLRSQGGQARLNLSLQASGITEGAQQHWRDEKLLGHWVAHLAANSKGVALTTIVITPAGQAYFAPLARRQAAAWLDILLQAWVEGMRRPLPIKAVFARPLLTAMSAELEAKVVAQDWTGLMQTEKVRKALVECEALWNRAGWAESFYESRAYPLFESLLTEGELLSWTQKLYRPLFIALRDKEAA